ncbi:hypothetical protein KP509_08G014400 [Ceratopteris richardii]|uniref:Uncharacterized protein n=1 Tax=Ceratopteris richardii TaxID=49495 RepID=A0A8T2UEA0_CERRI|nr:hypothetical protein KP509_08G014400 [Ceratopteris richardii]
MRPLSFSFGSLQVTSSSGFPIARPIPASSICCWRFVTEPQSSPPIQKLPLVFFCEVGTARSSPGRRGDSCCLPSLHPSREIAPSNIFSPSLLYL